VTTTNNASLTSLDWQVHVYGDAVLEIREICGRRRQPQQLFAWHDEMARSGFAARCPVSRAARRYLAMPAGVNPAAALASDLDARGIKPDSIESER
jgi:hypothetical protein